MFEAINKTRVYIFPALAVIFLLACSETPKSLRSSTNLSGINDSVVDYNRQIVKTESEEILDFINRYKWKMETSPTGLRYMIFPDGKGKKAGKGQIVILKYDLRLLNGTAVYSSDSAGPREFMVGTGSAENGLEEGVLMLRPGDRAKLIVPSHLAFGLLGDLKKIPGQAVLVYDVELIKVKNIAPKH